MEHVGSNNNAATAVLRIDSSCSHRRLVGCMKRLIPLTDQTVINRLAFVLLLEASPFFFEPPTGVLYGIK